MQRTSGCASQAGQFSPRDKCVRKWLSHQELAKGHGADSVHDETATANDVNTPTTKEAAMGSNRRSASLAVATTLAGFAALSVHGTHRTRRYDR